MIKQCKGKDLEDVTKSKLLNNDWLVSTKYDGHYIQIHKDGDVVKFFTSGGKEFYIPEIANELIAHNKGIDFILETEYIGTTNGAFGCRTKVGKLTTYRTNFEKGLSTPFDKRETFKVFDIIYLRSISDTFDCRKLGIGFQFRFDCLNIIYLGSNLVPITLSGPLTLEEAKIYARNLRGLGFEGAYAKQRCHLYEPGKRVNTAIKLKLTPDGKSKPTADLLCIDIIGGTGKYHGHIGSLVLQDSKGRTVAVGSGLGDVDRFKPYNHFIGKVIEVEYEQILNTYIQPVYLGIREDKTAKDIS